MKKTRKINKLIIVLLFIFAVSIIFSNYSNAVGTTLSEADEFLGKRKFGI